MPVMDARERELLRYLQQRKRDCEQMAERVNLHHAEQLLAKAEGFSEAASAFLRMVDEREEAND